MGHPKNLFISDINFEVENYLLSNIRLLIWIIKIITDLIKEEDKFPLTLLGIVNNVASEVVLECIHNEKWRFSLWTDLTCGVRLFFELSPIILEWDNNFSENLLMIALYTPLL